MQTRTDLAYAGMLVGGILILAGSVSMIAFMGPVGVGMPMGRMFDVYGYDTGWPWLAWWFGGIGLLTGGTLLFAASRYRRGGDDARPAATLAIVAGVLSTFVMGGFVLGAIVAILGGILGLTHARGATEASDGSAH
jgi:hypothetical protein